MITNGLITGEPLQNLSTWLTSFQLDQFAQIKSAQDNNVVWKNVKLKPTR